MDHSHAAMLELEQMLTRFHSVECSNEERFEINKLLENFSQKENVWKDCVYLIQNSSNEYLILYGINVIEGIIVQSWSSVSHCDKEELKQFVSGYLVMNYSVLPAFFRNKLVRLFVLIGRSDWPHSYPDFMDNILQLGKAENTRLLCVSLLQTASEELATSNVDFLSSKRQKELMSMLLNYVPSILNLLLEILSSGLWLQLLHSQSKTDPQFKFLLPFDVLHSSLTCLNHYFSWVPLSASLTPNLLEVVFKYANLGCLSGMDSAGHCGLLGALAMDCINELLIKNFVPQELELFLMNLFKQSFTLLQQLTSDFSGASATDFARLDDRYLSKCGDFFDYFVSSHLKRVEFNPNFPVLEFLALFYKYTFRQPEVDSYCVCLITWNVFLDHLLLSSRGEGNYRPTSPVSDGHIERYKEILITMTDSVLKKVQFHYNGIELGNIDDDTIDENETEWQSFIRQNLEFVGKVSELFPLDVLQMIVPLFDEYSKVYLSLSQLVVQQGKDRFLSISVGEQCQSVHAVLKDLTTILQALGRVSEIFCGEHFESMMEDAQKLVNQFCIIAKYGTDVNLFNVETPMPEVLDQGFIEVHCQVFGSIVAYQQWLSHFHQAVLQGNQSQDTLQYFISSGIESALPLISHDVPEKISLSACKLFETIALSVRSRFVFQYPLVQDLLARAKKGLLHSLPLSVSVMMYKGLLLLLILPWTNQKNESQEWDSRLSDIQNVVNGVTDPYYQLASTPKLQQNHLLQDQAKPVIKKTFFLLQEMISSLSDESTKAKRIFYQCIRSCVRDSVPLLQIYINQPDTLDQLMKFFYMLFKTFHHQIEAELTNEVTQTFMSLLTREHLESTMFVEDTVGYSVVIRFIDILKLLIQDVSDGQQAFFPNIVSFAMKQLYPALKMKDAPDMKISFYSLLFHLLLNNWRYFYPGNILVKMGTNAESVEHEEDLVCMIEAFGQSFVQADINVFRENISALKTLHEKRKLFSKVNFQSAMWEPFLNVLIQVLMLKSHDLLKDEISELVHLLASVDHLRFHTEFLPKFIGSIAELTEDQKFNLVKDYRIVEDYPSFTQNLSQLAVDVRFYLTQNAANVCELNSK